MAVLGLSLCLCMFAGDGESRGRRIWKWSLAALAGAHAADALTSSGRYELNPLLGRGPFGARAVGIKAGISTGGIAIQYFILKHHPAAARKAAFINFAMAGLTGGTATRNRFFVAAPQKRLESVPRP